MREWEKPAHPSKLKKKGNYEKPYCPWIFPFKDDVAVILFLVVYFYAGRTNVIWRFSDLIFWNVFHSG
jgi:hypothetical protein